MPDVSLAEVKSLRKSLTRWREDMNEQADEFGEKLAAIETKLGGKPKKKDDDGKPKGDGKGDDDDEEEEDDDDGLF